MLIEIALKVFICHVNVYFYLGKYKIFLFLSGEIYNLIHFPCFNPALNHILVQFFGK